MKKMIAISLVAILLFTSCVGCQRKQKNEQLNEQKKQQQNQQDEYVTICVDSLYEPMARRLVEIWEQLNDGTKPKLVIIPSDTAVAEIRIKELRTEIMSGGGPDVFILECAIPNTDEPMPVLFSNPQKAMYSDVFLPLDEYMDTAQYMNTDVWNQTILESGRTDEGQLLLPLYYAYYVEAFRTADIESAENIPSSWEELITCEDKAIMGAVAHSLFVEFPDIFGEFADYQNEMLLFSEKDLLARMQEAIFYNEKGRNGYNEPVAVASDRLGESFFSDLAKDSEGEHTLFAFPNMQGGITANVIMYAAINRNTEQPEVAFSLLDILFSDELMCKEGFKVGDFIWGLEGLYSAMGGILVSDDAFLKECERVNKEDVDTLQRLNSRINVVRYYSDLDRELYDMYQKCRNTKEESERKQIVSQTYDAMRMKLSE